MNAFFFFISFRKKHRLEDLAVPVDYLLDRVYICKIPLSMCLVDLEKAFDTVNRAQLLEVLQGYRVGPDMLEAICRLYMLANWHASLGDNECTVGASSGQ